MDADSNYPPQAPRTKLSGLSPNVEAIVADKPDLVVESDDTGNLTKRLAAFAIPVLELPPPAQVSGVYSELTQLGAATGHVAQAAREDAMIRSQIGAIVAAAPHHSRPITYYYELDQTYYSLTSSTFVGGLLQLLGMTSIADAAEGAASSGGYPQLSAEYILEANPDYIILADSLCCRRTARPRWRSGRLVQPGRGALRAHHRAQRRYRLPVARGSPSCWGRSRPRWPRHEAVKNEPSRPRPGGRDREQAARPRRRRSRGPGPAGPCWPRRPRAARGAAPRALDGLVGCRCPRWPGCRPRSCPVLGFGVPARHRHRLADAAAPGGAGGLVGAMLAGGGIAYQGVFRNPLADPYLLGVAAGAGLGATIAIVYGPGCPTCCRWLPSSGASGRWSSPSPWAGRQPGGRRRDRLTSCWPGWRWPPLTAIQTYLQQRSRGTPAVYTWILGGLHGGVVVRRGLILPYVAVTAVVLLAHRRMLERAAGGGGRNDEPRAWTPSVCA